MGIHWEYTWIRLGGFLNFIVLHQFFRKNIIFLIPNPNSASVLCQISINIIWCIGVDVQTHIALSCASTKSNSSTQICLIIITFVIHRRFIFQGWENWWRSDLFLEIKFDSIRILLGFWIPLEYLIWFLICLGYLIRIFEFY